MKTFLRIAFLLGVLLTENVIGLSQTFTNVAATVGLATPGAKDAGVCWADFNSDGYLDLVVNTENASAGTRLYFSNAGASFTDVTSTHALELASSVIERSAVAGDFNNDGNTDFVVNSFNRIEVWLNKDRQQHPLTVLALKLKAPIRQ